MVVLCTECKHSVTQSWNTTKVYWQFRGIILTWKYEPWKNIYQRFFYVLSAVGKPTSEQDQSINSASLTALAQPILKAMTGRGYNDTCPMGSQVTSERWNSYEGQRHDRKKCSLIRGCGGQIRIIIYCLKQWMWIVVSMTDVEFVARRILICYTIMKNGWKAKMRGCRTVIIWVFEWKSCQVLGDIISILNLIEH